MSTFTATVSELHDVGPRTREIVLVRPEMPLPPKAGQCLSVVHTVDGKKRIRPYTLASAAHEDTLRFVVDRLENGVTSVYMHGLEAGDTVELQGPVGTFTRIAPEAPELVLAAQGSGMAPMRAHLLELEAAGYAGTIRLHATPVPDGAIYWNAGLAELTERWPVLNVTLHDGLETLIRDVLADCPDADGRHAYLCGLKALVRPLKKDLKERGFARASLKTEAYD